MSAASPRYAEALFNAVSPDEADTAGQILAQFTALLSNEPELKRFLLNPTVPVSARKETALLLLPDNTPETVRHFIALLIENKRLPELSDINTAYRRLTARAANRIDIQVTSAQPLDDSQLAQIREVYIQRHNARDATINQHIDPSLLGGLRVQVGDKITDGSLRTRLTDLQAALM